MQLKGFQAALVVKVVFMYKIQHFNFFFVLLTAMIYKIRNLFMLEIISRGSFRVKGNILSSPNTVFANSEECNTCPRTDSRLKSEI